MLRSIFAASAALVILSMQGLADSRTVNSNGVMLGVYLSGGADELTTLEKQLGRRLALDFRYKEWDWSDGVSRQLWDIQQGRTPLIAWSANFPGKASCATAADIAAGRYDAQLKSEAGAAKSLSAKVLIDFIPEMTDRKSTMDCFYGEGWSADYSGIARAGAAYVAAQHHVVGIFRAAGAANVQWIFAPDGQPFRHRGAGAQEWTLFYPGSGWVDWIGVDHHVGSEQRKTFPDDFFLTFYRDTVGYGKPLIVAQTAALADPIAAPDAQTLWLTTARETIPTQFPALRAFVYNDHGMQDRGGANGGFMLSGAGLAAFKAMANDPNFGGR